jgi:PAS domain-containing protein
VREREPAPLTAAPGRMAPQTAASFVLIGAALALVERERRSRRRLALGLAAPVAAISVLALALVGCLYDATSFYAGRGWTAMACATAVGFLLLVLGLALACPEDGLGRLLASRGQAGTLARRLLPAALLLPILFGWLRIAGTSAGLFDPRAGSALVAVANAGLLALLVAATVREIGRREAQLEERARELSTARHGAERNADLRRAAEERLRLTIAGARVGTWEWNVATGEVHWSDRCAELFGLPPGSALGYEAAMASIDPDDRAAVEEAVRRSLEERADYEAEYRVV